MTEMKLSFTTYMQEPHLFNPKPFQNLRTMVNAISYKFVSTNKSTKSDGSFSIPVKKARYETTRNNVHQTIKLKQMD